MFDYPFLQGPLTGQFAWDLCRAIDWARMHHEQTGGVLSAREISFVTNYLFKRFPELKQRLPWVQILDGPTPVETMPCLQRSLGFGEDAEPWLWVKRDDQSDRFLGGNKARKLEYIMGEARQKGAKEVATPGGYGSNQAIATTVAAQKLGLHPILILGPQPISEGAKQKLLAFHALGAEMRFHGNVVGMGLDMFKFMMKSALSSETFYVPLGGSSAAGTLGYVNAFLELLDQAGRDGLPKRIVLPAGTGGTTAGLLVGTCLAGEWGRVRITAVDVSDSPLYTESSVRRLAKKVDRLIREGLSREHLRSFPICDYINCKSVLSYVKDYIKPGYGVTNPGVDATLALLKETESIVLDTTYSGKAMNYLADVAREHAKIGVTPEATLFWLTYNSYNLEQIVERYQWTNPREKWLDLPRPFHRLFR